MFYLLNISFLPFFKSETESKSCKRLLDNKNPFFHESVIILRTPSEEQVFSFYPIGNYMLKVNKRITRRRYEICSKLTKKTPERRRRSGVLIVNFEHISRLVLMCLLFEGINAGWISTN